MTAFISYRRGTGWGRMLADGLRLNGVSVYIDEDELVPGADFEESLFAALRAASVTIVVIDPHWANERNARGDLRLHDPADFVRREIEESLRLSIRIVPVLINSRAMPDADQLPAALAPLLKRHAYHLDSKTWESGVQRLARQIAPARQRLSRFIIPLAQELSAAVVVSLLAVLGLYYLYRAAMKTGLHEAIPSTTTTLSERVVVPTTPTATLRGEVPTTTTSTTTMSPKLELEVTPVGEQVPAPDQGDSGETVRLDRLRLVNECLAQAASTHDASNDTCIERLKVAFKGDPPLGKFLLLSIDACKSPGPMRFSDKLVRAGISWDQFGCRPRRKRDGIAPLQLLPHTEGTSKKVDGHVESEHSVRACVSIPADGLLLDLYPMDCGDEPDERCEVTEMRTSVCVLRTNPQVIYAPNTILLNQEGLRVHYLPSGASVLKDSWNEEAYSYPYAGRQF